MKEKKNKKIVIPEFDYREDDESYTTEDYQHDLNPEDEELVELIYRRRMGTQKSTS